MSACLVASRCQSETHYQVFQKKARVQGCCFFFFFLLVLIYSHLIVHWLTVDEPIKIKPCLFILYERTTYFI